MRLRRVAVVAGVAARALVTARRKTQLKVLQRQELTMMMWHSRLLGLALLLKIGQLRKRVVNIVLPLRGRQMIREEIGLWVTEIRG
jgi:hypothetical protein